MQEESILEFVSHYRETSPVTKTKLLMWASLAAHAIVVSLLVITPLLEITDVPEVESIATFMVHAAPPPPLPPPSPPPPALPASTETSRSQAPRAVVHDTDLVTPVAIPDEIPAEEFGAGALGEPFGVVGGVPGGVVGGIVGGLPEQPAPKPRDDEPIRLDHRAAEARVLTRVEPVYPDLAVQAHVQGVVLLEVLVGEDGTPRQVKVLRSVAMLEEAAKDAVAMWRWEPYTVAGRTVPFLVTVTVQFRLAS